MLRLAVDEICVPVASVQVEYHPFLDQSVMLAYLRERKIPLTAYSPLAEGRAAEDETLKRIADKHGLSAAQVAIAWLLDQDGVIAIPKAQRPESQQSNLDALNIRLDYEDRLGVVEAPGGGVQPKSKGQAHAREIMGGSVEVSYQARHSYRVAGFVLDKPCRRLLAGRSRAAINSPISTSCIKPTRLRMP
jgi:hypothetical protein